MWSKSGSMLNSFLLCAITIARVACGADKSLVRRPGGYPSPYEHASYQIPGYSPMELYLKNKLANFSIWVTTNVPESKLDSTLKVSDVAIHNRFYNLDLSFTDTPRFDGFTQIFPNCVNADLESGKITAGYSAYNVTLSGKYKGKGTILNRTHFSGEGPWRLRLSLDCVLETYFTYGNLSHIALEELPKGTDQPDGKYFRFYCSREGTPFNVSNLFGCKNMLQRRLIDSKFPGLFNTTEGTPTGEELDGAEALIRASLGRHLKMETDSVDIHPPSLGSLLYQHLKNVMQENSVFKMLNFQAAPRFYTMPFKQN